MDALSLILEALAPVEGKRVLDVGCGQGGLARALAARGLSVIGLDPNPDAIAAARAAVPGAAFEVASAERLPYADGSLDGAVFLNSLHHVPEPGAALTEAARVVRRGAPVVVVEPLAEGTAFAALRPIEDETEVRQAAQAAIRLALREGRLACLREVAFERPERFSDIDAFIARAVSVDPARRAAAETRRDAVAAAFEAVAPEADGSRVLVQPLRMHVLMA